MSLEETARGLIDAMQPRGGTEPYDTSATVLRAEGGTLWVHIPGGAEETPVQKTINASPGDVIQIRVGGGAAWAVGNATAPPTDDATANAAHQVAEAADGKAVAADAKAEEALELARLKVGYAEIDQAVINSLEVNGVDADWINAGTLNADRIGAGTIGVGKIDAQSGTFSVANIPNLNANKITAGTLDAARIGAGTISADKLTVGQGGNLYPVYDSFEQVTNDTLYFAKTSSATPTVIKSQYARNGSRVLRIVTATDTTTAWVSLGAASNNYGLVRLPAGQYVASAYFRRYNMSTDVRVRLTVIGKQTINDSLEEGEWTRLAAADATLTATTWTRVEVPFAVESGTTYPYVHLRPAVLVGDATVYVDCLQIEEVASGQGAGTWHPAGTTQIDGGTIVAQSIKAESLDVDSLFAADITATGSFQIDNDYFSLTANQGGVDIQAKSNLASVQIGDIYCGQGTPEIGGNAIVAAMHKTVTGTTNASGNIALGIPVNAYGVLCVWRTDTTSICTPFYPTTVAGWYAHVETTAGAAVTSTAVTLEVDYYYRIAVKPM